VVPTSKSPLPVEDQALNGIMLFGTTRVSLPNGISFYRLALAGCTSVTDIHMDIGQTTLQ